MFVHQQNPAPNSYIGNSSCKEKETTKKQKQEPVSTEISQAIFKHWRNVVSTSVDSTDNKQQSKVVQTKHKEGVFPTQKQTEDIPKSKANIKPTLAPSLEQKKTARYKAREEEIRKNKPKGMNGSTYLKLSNPQESSKIVAQAKFSQFKKKQIKQLKRSKQATIQFNSKIKQFERVLQQKKIIYGSGSYNNLIESYFPGFTGEQENPQNNKAIQRKEKESSTAKAIISETSKEKNNTGLPDSLKTGVENLSGYSLDDVKVYHNSEKPAQLQAHAFTQGTDIHVASGQEKHLPHEAWHIVQQKQGRVEPTMQMKGKINVNDDANLEKEADVMGTKAVQVLPEHNSLNNNPTRNLNQRPIQRVVVDDTDKSKVLLDKFNRQVESVQTIVAHIFTTRYRANAHAIMPAFDDLYDAVNTVFASVIAPAVFSEQSIPIGAVAEKVTALVHKVWLDKAEKKDMGMRLPSHDNMKEAPSFLKHYNFFDENMIWRWTSKPSTEQVYTAARDDHGVEITYDDIVKVVAAHSGGNDKSNPYIKTLSFGRNPSALMGVAASDGGDKRVLNIIDKAEYLYGINIESLASKGITAHAACARMISLFETEYILVSTPSFPSFSLDELATHKYKNPFKKNAILEMLVKEENMKPIEQEMGVVEPENVPEAIQIDLDFAKRIIDNALKVKKAAKPYSAAVRDKESMDPQVAKRVLTGFHEKF